MSKAAGCPRECEIIAGVDRRIALEEKPTTALSWQQEKMRGKKQTR